MISKRKIQDFRSSYNLVKLLVLLIGIIWEVIIEIVLCDGVNNVVCHMLLIQILFYYNS